MNAQLQHSDANVQRSDADAIETLTEETTQSQSAAQPAPETPAANERPSRGPATLLRIHRLVKEVEPWGILLAVVALLMSLAAFWLDYSDRVEERTVRAWQLLTTPAPGNSGKIAALEYLNRDDGLFCLAALQGHLWWLHGDEYATCLVQLKARSSLAGIDLSPPQPTTLPEAEVRLMEGLGIPSGAYLRYIDLRASDLTGASLRYADLSGADLTDAVLVAADLRGAKLSAAAMRLPEMILTLRQMNRRGVDIRKGPETVTEVDLMGANLNPMVLRHPVLRDAILIRADLRETDLRGADLRGANLDTANLRSADLSQANLGGADLSSADLSQANLGGADLRGARNLTQAQLDQACGDGATRLPVGLIAAESTSDRICSQPVLLQLESPPTDRD